MLLTRKQVVDILRRTGYSDLATAAMQALPDPVELDQVEEWGQRHGVTRDDLISGMGASS